MGFFYIEEEQESKETKQTHRDEILALANESLELTKDSPNENFADFLWNPLINEFEGNNYRIKGACEDPAVLRAYTIGKKYNDYWDYIDAMNAYYAYIEYIDDSYGSFEMMQNSSLIYIPKAPKLMNKKQNKKMLRNGFIPSRINDDGIDYDVIKDLTNNAIPAKELYDDETEEISKVQKRLLRKTFENREKTDRINSIYAYGRGSDNTGMDAIVNFLSNPTKNMEDVSSGASFFDRFSSIHDEDYIPQDILEYKILPKSPVIMNGRLTNPEESAQIEILEELVKNGFMFLDTALAAGMNTQSVRMITSKYGLNKENPEEMTPKQLKKYKKKMAKQKKRARDRAIGDRRLQDAMLRNRISLGDGEFANFRLSDILPGCDE